jgi:Zn-dependent protease
MKSAWRVGRVIGIDLYLDVGWFIIAALLIYTLGFIEFPRELQPRALHPRADVTSITLGILASLLLFASVLAHEFAHAWMALQRGIGVKRVTLFIFGGVAQIAEEPDRPSSEFLIAVMGPLMSIALAAVFGAVWLWLTILDSTGWLGEWLTAPILLTSILTQANGALALFNLAPGFPLDGGRILRATLWGITRDLRRATRWATRAGQLVALLLIAAGTFLFFVTSNSAGIWYALVGMFLWNVAGDAYHQTVLLETLRQVPVRAVMLREVNHIPPDLPLSELVEQYILPRREQTFAVSDERVTLGTITYADVKRVRRDEWRARRVRDVMTPLAHQPTLAPDQTVASALARLGTSEADELPVVENETIIGWVGHTILARYLKLVRG